MGKRIGIVGAGPAAQSVAEAYRDSGGDGEVMMFSIEPRRPTAASAHKGIPSRRAESRFPSAAGRVLVSRPGRYVVPRATGGCARREASCAPRIRQRTGAIRPDSSGYR